MELLEPASINLGTRPTHKGELQRNMAEALTALYQAMSIPLDLL